MAKVQVFFTNGFEEIEALTIVDLLRRALIEVEMISVTGELYVTGSHSITVKTDKLFEDICDDADIAVLPGGMPGTLGLKAHTGLGQLLKKRHESGKYIAAICAAPSVFGALGILEGRKAVCFPGRENELLGANVCFESTMIDGNIITSRAVGTAIDFSLELVGVLLGEKTKQELKNSIVY